jgi:hypothetical protein
MMPAYRTNSAEPQAPPPPTAEARRRARRRVYTSLAISVAIVVLVWGSALALFAVPGIGPYFAMFFAGPAALVPIVRAATLCSKWTDLCVVLATTVLGLWGASQMDTDPYANGHLSVGPTILVVLGVLLPLITMHVLNFWRLKKEK